MFSQNPALSIISFNTVKPQIVDIPIKSTWLLSDNKIIIMNSSKVYNHASSNVIKRQSGLILPQNGIIMWFSFWGTKSPRPLTGVPGLCPWTPLGDQTSYPGPHTWQNLPTPLHLFQRVSHICSQLLDGVSSIRGRGNFLGCLAH